MTEANRKTFTEYIREDAAKQLEYATSDAVEEAIREGGRATVRDDYERVAEITQRLASTLLETGSTAELRAYAAEDADDRVDVETLRQCLRSMDDILATARDGELSDAGKDRLGTAFESLAAISDVEGHTDDVSNRVPVYGFDKRIGTWLQDEELDIGDEACAVSEQAGTLKTLFVGGTGMGKSCGLETEAEDYYQRNFSDGRDFKLIDLVDLRDGDTWMYDIPQQQEVLRNVREEQGLPPDFTDSDDYGAPEIEILAPLTPGLSEQNLPFDTEAERFTVRPFTVPASDLRKPLLVSLIMARLSEGEEQTVREAYDDVRREYDDWALADLADEIRDRDELSPKHKKKAVSVLRALQDEGYIRTRESEHTIGWRDIFTDTDTITVFTQALCETAIGQFMAFAYLVDAIVQNREDMFGVPDCVLLMRELWKVTPHKRRQHYDDRAAAIQETIGHLMSTIFRENRHSGIHLLADTQQPSDLLKPVREMFNRYVVYNANYDTIKDIFSWTSNNHHGSFAATMTAKRGQAGIVGQVEPAIENRDIEFISPIEYAAPSHHHADADVDDNGWRARTKYLDREELRQPADVDGVYWPDSVPESLEVQAVDRDDGPDVDMSPVAAFVDECLYYNEHDWIHKADVRAIFNEFMRANSKDTWDFGEHSMVTTFSNRFNDAIERLWDDGEDTKTGTRDGDQAYINLALNGVGKQYADNAHTDDESSAAEPIRSGD